MTPRKGVTSAHVERYDMSVIEREGVPAVFADGDGTIVVNFGLLTGREATQAELDRLAHALRRGGVGPEMTITATRRQDYGPHAETVVHLVQVSVLDSPTQAPTNFVEDMCARWARNCAEDRSLAPLSL